MKVELKDIKIPYYFLPPNPKKYSSKLNMYKMNGEIDPIILDDNMTLVDGYITYLIYKDCGATVVDIFYDDEYPLIYIDGYHLRSNKLYTWYVPRRLHKRFLKKVQVGDTVKCRSNNRTVPVIVEKIYTKEEKEEDREPVIKI